MQLINNKGYLTLSDVVRCCLKLQVTRCYKNSLKAGFPHEGINPLGFHYEDTLKGGFLSSMHSLKAGFPSAEREG